MLKVFVAFALLISTSAFSQDSVRKNDLYFEFLGNAIGSSFNYERGLIKNQRLRFRVGVGYYSGDQAFRFSFPVGINYLIPLKNDVLFIETGAGVTNSHAYGFRDLEFHGGDSIIIDYDWSARLWNFIPSVGLRKHTRSGWMWKISATPIINRETVMPWGGFSIGKRF